jgi:hypothetical protein
MYASYIYEKSLTSNLLLKSSMVGCRTRVSGKPKKNINNLTTGIPLLA